MPPPARTLNPDNSPILSGAGWRLIGELQFTAAGSSGQIASHAQCDLNYYPSSVALASIAVDTTAAQQLTVLYTPSASGVSLTVQGGYWKRKPDQRPHLPCAGSPGEIGERDAGRGFRDLGGPEPGRCGNAADILRVVKTEH